MKDLSKVTLPSGKVVEFVETNGLGCIRAIQKAKNKEQIPFALACEEMQVDGKPVILEDFLTWGSKDFMAATAAHALWSDPEAEAEGNLKGAEEAEPAPAAPALEEAPLYLPAPTEADLHSAGALSLGTSSSSETPAFPIES